MIGSLKSTDRAVRLIEVDALRGLAAISVVLFHFTSKFQDLYPGGGMPAYSFLHGHYGVNLFFVISGFVIFMTLDKTLHPMDFVVSRFSRLFPAYWAAIFLTFAVCHILGLPGKLVGLGSAVANMIMIHGLFRVPHVDGVYWTLEVELLFYFAMFALYRLGALNKVHLLLFGLLLGRLVYFLAEQWYAVSLPWLLYRILILQYIPWFALGIAVYQVSNRQRCGSWRWPLATSILAVGVLFVCESNQAAFLAVVFASSVYFAANGYVPILKFSPLVWLGTISYPLYLLHENIGWAVQLKMLSFGASMDITVVGALLVSLVLSTVVAKLVEKPAMRWIRDSYRRRDSPAR